MRIPKASTFFHAVVWMYAIAATLLIVMLVRRHENLSRDYRTLRQRSVSAYRGMTVPVFEATSSDTGQPVRVGEPPDSGAQLLLLVRASCQYCKETIPVWKNLVTAVDSANKSAARGGDVPPRFSVLALAVEATADSSIAFLAEHKLRVPVVTFPGARMRRMYRTSLTPQTLVIGPEGRVLFAKAGVFRNQAEIDSARRIATTSPGVRRPSATQAITKSGSPASVSRQDFPEVGELGNRRPGVSPNKRR